MSKEARQSTPEGLLCAGEEEEAGSEEEHGKLRPIEEVEVEIGR